MVFVNVTPNELLLEQDQLLASNSKLSYRELYNKQKDLPLYRNKFYKDKDVHQLFRIMNGILTSISEDSYGKSKMIEELRSENISLESKVSELEKQVNETSNNEQLENALIEKQNELYDFVIKNNERFSELEQEFQKMDDKLQDKDKLIKRYEIERVALVKEIQRLRAIK